MKEAKRLIVAADFSPKQYGGRRGVAQKVTELSENLAGSGVVIKVNSILRSAGYDLIETIHDHGNEVFADLKLNDIPNTLKFDAELLKEVGPEMLTVMACVGIDGMSTLQHILGRTTEVLGVTVLTSYDEAECQAVFGCSLEAGIVRFARLAQLAKVRGLILSLDGLAVVARKPELRDLILNTPGIRPEWTRIKNDDQIQVSTIQQAIEAGADRVVVGRPIVEAHKNNDGLPQGHMEAVERALEEIQEGLRNRKGENIDRLEKSREPGRFC